MPTPTILFYAPAPQPYAPKLLSFCAVQGFKLRILESADLDRTLSVLSQGLRRTEPPREDRPLPEPLLIFCRFSERQLDRALQSLRKNHISCLKAVLTPSNTDWTLRSLYEELIRERQRLS